MLIILVSAVGTIGAFQCGSRSALWEIAESTFQPAFLACSNCCGGALDDGTVSIGCGTGIIWDILRWPCKNSLWWDFIHFFTWMSLRKSVSLKVFIHTSHHILRPQSMTDAEWAAPRQNECSGGIYVIFSQPIQWKPFEGKEVFGTTICAF